MINHCNNQVWVNKYPLDGDEYYSIVSLLKATVKERCSVEEEMFDESRITISHSTPEESPFSVPNGNVAGVYWFNYSD